MNLVPFLVLILAVWRISSLVTHEDGPYKVFLRFRLWAGVQYQAQTGDSYASNEFAAVLKCLWCNSVWLSLGLVILYYFFPTTAVLVCLPLAVSAGAIVIDGVVLARL